MEQKHFTVKAWAKFSPEAQQALTQKYDIILDDHKTRNEKIIQALKKFSIRDFQKAMDKFDKAFDEWDKAKSFKIFPTEEESKQPLAPDRDYSFLTGKNQDAHEAFWGKRSNKRI